MSKNIIMKGVGAYIPPNKVYNDEIDEHFEQRGLSAHSLMKHLGRRKRYFMSEGRNCYYKERDRETMEENVNQFGLQNVIIVDHVGEDTFKDLPVPDVTMLVASASLEQELSYLTSINRDMSFVIYTLDFKVAATIRDILLKYGLSDVNIIQIAVSYLTSKNVFENQPAPWIITAGGKETD